MIRSRLHQAAHTMPAFLLITKIIIWQQLKK